MSYGSPHCETIKTQAECHRCGTIVPEYYTGDEMKLNRLIQRNENVRLSDCREALKSGGGDEQRAQRILDERYLETICRCHRLDSAENFARRMMNKPLALITDSGLQVLTIAAFEQAEAAPE